MCTDFYVYVYIDPINHEPFYVGKGKYQDKPVLDRYIQHFRGAIRGKTNFNKHLYNRIKSIIIKGNHPSIFIYQSDIDETTAFKLEQELILRFGRRDLKTGSLTNLADGGKGGAISPDIVSVKTQCRKYRAKQSSIKREYWSDKERRSQQSKAIKATWENNDNRRKQVAETFDKHKDRRIAGLREYYANASDEEREQRNMNISKALKDKSTFILNNPKSVGVITPQGVFKSIRQAQKASDLSTWVFRQMFIRDPENYKFIEE